MKGFGLEGLGFCEAAFTRKPGFWKRPQRRICGYLGEDPVMNGRSVEEDLKVPWFSMGISLGFCLGLDRVWS